MEEMPAPETTEKSRDRTLGLFNYTQWIFLMDSLLLKNV